MQDGVSEEKVVIQPVAGRRQLKDFVNLPWTIYGKDPHWAPPIRSAVEKLVNVKKHPFWQKADGLSFIATQGGKTVGRITAIIDHNSNDYHRERIGSWGFFECINHQGVADALFGAVEAWLRDRGITKVVGPLNPSTNYEIGTLIKGFDQTPALMMTYNPAYYPELIFKAGYRKEKDIFSYRITRDHPIPPWIFELSDRLRQSDQVEVVCPKKWTRDNVRLMCSIYNECWAENWGFVPMSMAEEDEMARELLYLLEPELAFFIHCQGQPAGIGLLLPDFVPLLKRFNGNLGLAALLKKFLYMHEITGLRGLLFGIKPQYRRLGLHLVAIGHVMEVMQSLTKYHYAELGWTLEDNAAINKLFEEAGLNPAKRYRIYHKILE